MSVRRRGAARPLVPLGQRRDPPRGCGTVATAARGGVPQIVLPQAADQFLWRSQVVALGLGAAGAMLRRASAGSLARAITAATSEPAYRHTAAAMAARLQAARDGVAASVAEITSPGERHPEGDRRWPVGVSVVTHVLPARPRPPGGPVAPRPVGRAPRRADVVVGAEDVTPSVGCRHALVHQLRSSPAGPRPGCAERLRRGRP